MLRAYRYRIYPTVAQSVFMNKHIGASRYVYNLALETKISGYRSNAKKTISRYDLQKDLTDLKKEENTKWLKEVNSQSLTYALKQLDAAYLNFFKRLKKGGEKEKGFPKFKGKFNGNQSFHVPQNGRIEDRKLILPKFRSAVKIVIHKEPKGILKEITVNRSPSGKYHAAMLYDTGEKNKECKEIKEDSTLGIKLGLKDFYVTSNNDRVEAPNYLEKYESRLKYVQRKYSKYKGKRTKLRLQKLHEKVANQRKYFLDLESFKLVRDSITIAIEDLNVKEMMKNHHLAKSLSDVGWSRFTNILKYKCEWYGVNLIQCGKFDMSSPTCTCGKKNNNLKLKDRKWVCDKCGREHDRDLLAAKNIKKLAIDGVLSSEDRKNQKELSTLVEA